MLSGKMPYNFRMTQKETTKNIAFLSVCFFLVAASIPVYLVFFPKLESMYLLGMVCISGATWELKNHVKHWKDFLWFFIISFMVSQLVFFTNNILDHCLLWPISFGFIAFIAVFSNRDERFFSSPLLESKLLFWALGLIYLIVELRGNILASEFNFFFIIIGLIFSFYLIYHSLTYKIYSPNARIFVSAVFALTALLMAYLHSEIITYSFNEITHFDLLGNLPLVLSALVFGASIPFIWESFILLIGLTYESEKDRKEHREKMIKRVAADQIKIGHSIIIILGCSVLFGANMVFQFFSPISLFWTVVLLGNYYHKKAYKVTPAGIIERLFTV